MNKKILAMGICMLLLATIPVAVGKTSVTAPEIQPPAETQGFLGKTVVRGFIFGYHTKGLMTSFFAVFCHYKTFYLLREPVSGIYFMKNVEFLGKIKGHIGMIYINGVFHGTPF